MNFKYTTVMKLKMKYQKVRQRFGIDVMVRPNYSVLDIGVSVRPNLDLGSVENVEIRGSAASEGSVHHYLKDDIW